MKKNPTYYETIVKSDIWKKWTKHQEQVMEFDIWESIECGWLSDRHWEAFLEWFRNVKTCTCVIDEKGNLTIDKACCWHGKYE